MDDELSGEEIRSTKGKFLVIREPIINIDYGCIGQHCDTNIGLLSSQGTRARFPRLFDRLGERLAFLDIESCGFSYNDPIFLITLFQTRGGEPISRCSLLARDFTEESPMLEYFLSEVRSSDTLVTYCGKSFDCGRIDRRALDLGLGRFLVDENFRLVSLDSRFGSRHVDLKFEKDVQRTLRNVGIVDGGLQSFEKIAFGYIREGEISHERVPTTYFEFVTRRKKVDLDGHRLTRGKSCFGEYARGNRGKDFRFEPIDEKIALKNLLKVIRHNAFDTQALIAMLLYHLENGKENSL